MSINLARPQKRHSHRPTPRRAKLPTTCAAKTRRRTQPARAAGGPLPRLLVAEDSRTQASELQAVLEAQGFAVEVSRDGQEGWEKLLASPFDLVVSDVMMPRVSGYELCRRIKSTPATQQLPVVLLTALADSDSIIEGLKHGADSYVIKPFDEQCLVNRVRALLDKVARHDGADAADSRKETGEASPPPPGDRTERMLDYFAATLDDFVRTRDAEQKTRQSDSARIAGALVQVGGDLAAAGRPSETMERVCRLTMDLLGCDASYSYLLRPERKTYVAEAAAGLAPDDWDLLREIEIPAANLQPLLAQLERDGVVEMDSTCHERLGDGLPRSAADVYILLRSGAETIGFQVAAYRNRPSSRAARRQERLVRSLAPIATLAANTARLGEELQKANRIKYDFVNVVSHEMRTPLHVILGYSDLLLSGALGGLSEQQEESLQRLHTSAASLAGLIGDFLDVRRLQQGYASPRITAVHMTELAGDLRRELDHYPCPETVELQWEVEPHLPVVFTDRNKLKVVWKNLVTNALKFTDAGVVRVRVRSGDGGVDFTVSDTGVGIAPDVLPIIFECFRQGDSSITRPAGGTGIGLYLVRELLAQLGGRIDVDTTVGRGSTFRAWIPLTCEAIETREAATAPAAAPTRHW